MKRILYLLLLMLPIISMAQKKGENIAKYLTGAVPVENGKVVFKKQFQAPLNVNEMYSTVTEWANQNYQPIEAMPNHKVLSSNDESYELTVGGEEYLVFANRLLSLDRTRIYYKVKIICHDKQCTANIYDIRYWYEEEREGGERYTAEEWITDKWGLNKKGTKLSRMSGKFRRKTIDRVEELFADLETTINRKAVQKMMKE